MKPISALTWILTPSGVLVTLMHHQYGVLVKYGETYRRRLDMKGHTELGERSQSLQNFETEGWIPANDRLDAPLILFVDT